MKNLPKDIVFLTDGHFDFNDGLWKSGDRNIRKVSWLKHLKIEYMIVDTLVRRKLGMVVAQKNPEFLIFRRGPVTENWEIPNF